MPLTAEANISVYVNEQQVSLEQQPITDEETTNILVPFRNIFENLGFKVLYDKHTNSVVGQSKSLIIKLLLNDTKAKVNGQQILLTNMKIVNGRTMVPLSFISQIGCKVDSEVKPSKLNIHISYKNLPEVDFKKRFEGYNGTFKLYDISRDRYITFNELEAAKSTSPASTYKVLHSLIALQTEVLGNENSSKKWNGQEYPVKSWNQDHTLKSAVQNSVV